MGFKLYFGLVVSLFVGCIVWVTVYTETAPEPKFVYDQAVIFKVPKFYQNVCDGTGLIVSYYCETRRAGGCTYNIYTASRNSSCPLFLYDVSEGDIKAAK